MSDHETRAKERKAKVNGDERALESVQRDLVRVGMGRHHKLIGTWVVIDGVRTSYRGILTGVEEVGGGVAILHGDTWKALESLADVAGEKEIGTFEIYTHAVLGIGPQPKGWPTK